MRLQQLSIMYNQKKFEKNDLFEFCEVISEKHFFAPLLYYPENPVTLLPCFFTFFCKIVRLTMSNVTDSGCFSLNMLSN